MENATKALTIAASVLIALMIISVLIYMFSQIKETTDQDEKAKALEKTLAFNAEFESFNRKNVYGAELMSLINKIYDYNEREVDEKGYMELKAEVTFRVAWHDVQVGRMYSAQDIYSKLFYLQSSSNPDDKELVTDFKRKMFKCNGTVYDENTGRICKFVFEEINLSNSIP